MDTPAPSGATFSEDRIYRYALWRRWPGDGRGICIFIGLNPSTANELDDDPTIRRCIGYAKMWGFQELRMLNLFAYRSTDPKKMLAHRDPIGPENDYYISHHIMCASLVIAAWGMRGDHLYRGAAVRAKYRGKLRVLGLTKHRQPLHPLYLPKSLEPVAWN